MSNQNEQTYSENDIEQLKIMGETIRRYDEANKCKGECHLCDGNNIYCCEVVIPLYDAGWRNADDVRKETAKDILEELKALFITECLCKPSDKLRHATLKKIADRYGVEVEK